MSWMKHQDPHYCDLPSAYAATAGDRWRCDDCGSVWRRTSAHPAHEHTGRFSVWRRAWIGEWRAKQRDRRAGREPAPVWRNVPYDQIESGPTRLLHPEEARPSGGLPIVRESDGTQVF